MKQFLRSKLFLTLVAFVMIGGAIAFPLSGSIIHSHAQTTAAQCPQGKLCRLTSASPTQRLLPKTNTYNLVVNASQDLPGLDTGIDLVVGSNITITASGQATFGIGSTQDCNTTEETQPDGQLILTDGTLCPGKIDPSAVLPSSPVGELLANFGSTGWFAVGSNDGFTSASNGRLYLLYNDISGQYGNNSGSYQVTITTSTSPALTVQTVFTRDGNGNVKNTFANGDAIQYAVYINNSSSNSIVATFKFMDYWGSVNNSLVRIFNSTITNITIPSGLSGWYTQSKVPNTALAGGYTDQVQVLDQGNSQDKSTGYGQFTVRAGKLFIPSTGSVTNLFLDQPDPENWYKKYYDQSNTLQISQSPAHSGVDIAEPNPPTTDCTTGQTNPVYAAAAGLVIWAGFDSGGFGWSVVVKHGYGFRGSTHYIYTLYAHMGTAGTDSGTSKSCLKVKVNTKTTKSTLLGYQGTSGNSSGIHLHFMFFAGDQDVTAAQLSSIYNFVNLYSTYPASPDFYTCIPLTYGDNNPLPVGNVTRGQNSC